MKSGVLFGLVVLGVSALMSAAVMAQSEAPTPMPRPADRMPETPAAADALPVVDAETGAADPEPPLPDPALAAAVEAAAAAEALASIVVEKQKVSLTAQITENGMNIAEGLVWRIFDTQIDSSGELALAARSDDASPTFELAPGRYAVHVAYGRAQTSVTIDVPEGGVTQSIVLDAGALRLNAAIAGDIPIPSNLVRFDLYTTENGEQVLKVPNIAVNDIVTLTAGTYQVVSHFGGVNAVVRTGLHVEPGQLTDATLYHHAAQITFKLASEAGGEAIADVDWTVKTAGGETIFSEIGAFPSAVLAEGDYLVFAKRGDTVYNREFEVQPGQGREIEVLTTVY